MPLPDLTGLNIEDTYQRILQTDGTYIYDGTGSLVVLSGSGTTLPGGPNTSVQFNKNGTFSGSSALTFNSASNSLTLTGSLNVSGSTLQIGNNTLLGNTTLSGSIIISGALGTSNPTVRIYGDTTHNGYLRFDPVNTNIDPTISASYIYVSGSTNDLYFSQNGNGYANTTRLRWLEGNLYTGLLNGGIITATTGSTTYRVSSGSGVIVNLNASYNDNPYPTIQYLSWGNLTASIAPLSASYDQSFIAINSNAQITASGIPYNDGDYNTKIPIGIVIHQNHSTINASQTFPSVAYGWKQRSYDFIKAFGPLKISGYALSPSGSSTRGLVLSGGTAWVDGRNYTVDPNNPSYITEATGITTSKIYRYYQSGSDWAYDTNGGAGYTAIDPTQYSNNGVLTPVSTNNWTIQRVFYFPNSATKAFYIYYGNAQYANQSTALAAVNTEAFTEAPNTAANAIYVGYMLLRHNADFTVPASYTIQAGGLFRSMTAGGGGGGTTSPGGSNTQIQYNNNGAFGGVSNLTWDGTTLSATGSFTGSFTGSLLGTASYATTASYAISSSYAFNSTTASYALNGGVTQILAGSNISISPSNGLGQVTISSTGGGGGTGNTATGSYGSFYSTQTQTASLANTTYPMSFNTTDISNGVAISGSTNTLIKVTNAGVYNLQFSAQLARNVGSGTEDVLIWLRKNGVDLAYTNTDVTFAGGTNVNQVAAWNWFVNANANDYYEIVWSTTSTNIVLLANTTPNPDVPSIILTANRIDQFLSNTGSFSGSFNGVFTGSLNGTSSWASNAISASYAATASYVLNAISSSFASTASYVLNAVSASSAITSSYPIFVTGSTIYSTGPATSNFSSNSSIFLGSLAGNGAVSSNYSIFLGLQAGQGATIANESVFIGPLVGLGAAKANGSVFLGSGTGQNAVSASYSILMGYYAGYSPSSTGVGPNNIIIGNNITLPDNTRNSINLGAIIFATGSYSTLGGTPYSGSQYNIGRVGINKRTPDYTLDVSGSGNYSNGLTVTGSLRAPSITGSLQGTASYAITASYAMNAGGGSPGGVTGNMQYNNGGVFGGDNNFNTDGLGAVSITGSLTIANTIETGNYRLVDGGSSVSLNWRAGGQGEQISTGYYFLKEIKTSIQENFIQYVLDNSLPNYEGETIQGTLDSSVQQFDLIALDTDGIWYRVTQNTNISTKMLGICLDANIGRELILLEGNVVIQDGNASFSPTVYNVTYGVPVYIKEGTSSGEMDTTLPTANGGYVRRLGHCYYHSINNGNYWILKFRPSNDSYYIS